MAVVRKEMVSVLVDAAIYGMEQIPESTSSEVMSAAMTLALRTIQAVLQLHPDQRPMVQDAVSLLMLECADGKVN